MKLKRDVIGVVLAFMSAGFVATGMNASAYQEVYDTQAKQEQKVQKAIASEFITPQDKNELKQTVVAFDEAKTKENRDSLQDKIKQQKKLLAKINSRLEINEAKTAAHEYNKIIDKLGMLTKKSQEVFIEKADEQQVEVLATELAEITAPKKVKPVRQLAKKTTALAEKMSDNQTEMKNFVANLKADNQAAVALQKNKFLAKTDKNELGKLQKENEKYFKDADDLITLQSRREASNSLLFTLQDRAKDTEQDFSENEEVARKLIQAANELLAKGDLNPTEKTELNQVRTALNDALGLKNYQPGDLSSNYTALKTNYDSSYKVSNERKIEAKRQAEEAARKKAAKRKEAQEKAEQQKAAQAQKGENAAANNEIPAPIPSAGGWHQAPPGYKFLKVESSKTYGQVKNPGNFRLITEAEAANYTPGHGNGSAKQ